MKKIIKTLITSLLVLITVMTTACAPKEEGGGNTTPPPAPPSYEGTHIYTAPEVEDERYIIKNSEFLYTVVVPANATSREKIAKDEFVALIL